MNKFKQLLNLFINLLLLLLSILLIAITTWLGFIWALFRAGSIKNLSDYFLDFAIMIDRTGNVSMRYVFNDTLIKKDGYRFGEKDETISGVIGKNYKMGTLRFMGKKLANGLEKIDPNHLEDAIKDNPQDI